MNTHQHETEVRVNVATRVTPGMGGEFRVSWGEGMDWPWRIASGSRAVFVRIDVKENKFSLSRPISLPIGLN